MQTKRINPNGVRVGLVISQAAKNAMFDNGYATDRTIGRFISQLVIAHHARVSRKPTQAEIAQELRRLASLLEEVTQYSKIDKPYNHKVYPPDKPMPDKPMPDKPMPLANIIDSPPGLVGVTVISEEDGVG